MSRSTAAQKTVQCPGRDRTESRDARVSRELQGCRAGRHSSRSAQGWRYRHRCSERGGLQPDRTAVEERIALCADHDGDAHQRIGRSGYIPNDAAFGMYTFEVVSSRLQPGCAETAIVNGILDLDVRIGKAELKLIFAAAILSAILRAQPRTVATPYNALHSPDVHPDRTVTLRFRAPAATSVDLAGEITLGKGPQPLAKGADGVWTITVGPLPPEIWSYNFRVQGVDVPDPSNPSIKPVPPGEWIASFVEIPQETPAFYDSPPVPHGEVRIVLYESKAMSVTRFYGSTRALATNDSKKKYPVLYLLHGNGEAQDGWVMNGRANIILDNLIAAGKAQPMLVVMPQGHALQAAGVAPLVRLTDETTMYSERFPKDLLGDVIPLVEKKFRVIADADHRAIAGLSMGGGQALTIGLTHVDLFHYALGYSAALSQQFMDSDEVFKEALAVRAGLNTKLRLLWISCGKQDFLYQANRQFADMLKAKGVNLTYRETEGAHVWSVWRNNLNDSVPLLFRR